MERDEDVLPLLELAKILTHPPYASLLEGVNQTSHERGSVLAIPSKYYPEALQNGLS